DITLRDGEQAAGVNFFPEEKLRIAEQLVKMNLPIIEAGFPIASDSDFEGVRLVASKLGTKDGPIICAMARAEKKDIDRAWQAVSPAAKPRIQVVLATSDIHMKYKLIKTRPEILEQAANMVDYARQLTDDVEFAAEDATRSDPEFLHQVFKACVEAGAKTLEIPDTVGYSTPEEYALIVRGVLENVVGDRDIVISVHCHNDLGLATANTLAGIRAGARQAECTINGIGERVGNAAFEEVVMALKTRQSYYGFEIAINTTEIMNTSRLVSELANIPIAPNKAIVGKTAFVHESGIHQHGMISNRETYQIVEPEAIGLKSYSLVLGKLSGSHALKSKIEELGFKLSEADFRTVYQNFKDFAGKKKFIVDEDIVNLVNKIATKR
ncbi:MAG: 2-isopropylmalate synthase, partial [Chloroflexi bacterium]|nr:2-isopropylmalate synthase [Chloroflexota bacterium]